MVQVYLSEPFSISLGLFWELQDIKMVKNHQKLTEIAPKAQKRPNFYSSSP